MQDKWYADNRDLVKWGVLLELARRSGARQILQVLYHRQTIWGMLEIDGEHVKLPEEVVRHFRDCNGVSSLQCQIDIKVVSEPFENRQDYLGLIVERIQARTEFPGILFLDPDTGLEPGSPGPKHVLESELSVIWRAMRPQDVLVFYQHKTNYRGAPWIESKKEQFERALGLPSGTAKLARAPEIADDVAFFYVEKKTETI